MDSMGIGGLTDYSMAGLTGQDMKSRKLEESLKNSSLQNADDKELMDACKSFEAYFVEQVFKEMEKTVHKEEDDNEYMQYFGDMLIQEYAESVTEGEGIGIAKMLYESMKRQ